jgi:hypothetical protein
LLELEVGLRDELVAVVDLELELTAVVPLFIHSMESA